MRRLSWWIGALVALVASSALADDQIMKLPEKLFTIRLFSDHLEVTTDFGEVLDKTRKANLDNGFTTTILIRAYLYNEADPTTPLAISVREVKIVYDLWEEVYSVQTSEPGSTMTTLTTEKEKVIPLSTSLKAFPLYFDTPLTSGVNYTVAVIVEVNPLSQELLAETRKWLSRTSGSSAKAGKSSSFFGSFVSIFVNVRKGSAELTYKFRSPVFTPPAKKS